VRAIYPDSTIIAWSNTVTGTTLASTSVTKSLIFTAASSQALTRAWGAGGSRTQWTFSTWFKRTSIGAYHILFSCWTANDDTGYLALLLNAADNRLHVSGWTTSYVTSGSAAISDTTTWHHVVVACDTPNAIASDRIKLYLDGVDVTTVVNNPGAGASLGIGQNATHRIGVGETGAAGYFDGMLAGTYFVDGIVLDHRSFAGHRHPKSYTGSFGAKGFWLTYFDATSTTTLGQDDATGEPGNAKGSNDWTLSNMTTANSSTDVPP
jgi:hypothetical protein